MLAGGATGPSGALGLTVIRGDRDQRLASVSRWHTWPNRPLTVAEIGKYGHPQKGLPDAVNAWRKANRQILARGVRKVLLARALKLPTMYGQLFLDVIRGDGELEQLGLASLRVVTTAGVRFICDDFNAGASSADVSNMKFHGFGTGAAAEAVGNTGLGTEETTQYVVDNTRPTGSQASATVSNDATYTTVATYSPDSGGTRAITEHGIFSASTAGTLLDRSVFSAVNLVAGADSLQATYVFTVVAGG